MLEVVEHEQQLLPGEVRDETVDPGAARRVLDAEHLSDRRRHEGASASDASATKKHAVLERLEERLRCAEGESRLPRPAGAGQGHDPRALFDQERLDPVELLAGGRQTTSTSDGRLFGRPPAERNGGKSDPERRDDDLVQAFRLVEILQPVLPEVAQRDAGIERRANELGRRLRQDDLLPVRGGHQAGAAVESRAEVVRSPPLDLAGVEPHSDADLAQRAPVLGGERKLGRASGLDGSRGGRERRVHRIPDRLEHDAAAALDGTRPAVRGAARCRAP